MFRSAMLGFAHVEVILSHRSNELSFARCLRCLHKLALTRLKAAHGILRCLALLGYACTDEIGGRASAQ